MEHERIETGGSFSGIETWETAFGVCVYGIKFDFRADSKISDEWLGKLLPPESIIKEYDGGKDVFTLITDQNKEGPGLYWNSELVNGFNDYISENIEVLEGKVQFALSMRLAPNYFFLHAGAVDIDGAGILIPGNSNSGKTTLTAAFISEGAGYHSDDCAVVSSEGHLEPYATPLKIRIDKYKKKLVEPANFGALAAKAGTPVRFIILTSYGEGERWLPTVLGDGRGAWNLVPHLFYPPVVRKFPAETLSFLTRLSRDCIVLEGKRGEAAAVVRDIRGRLRDLRLE